MERRSRRVPLVPPGLCEIEVMVTELEETTLTLECSALSLDLLFVATILV
jgi:hypothetical protein